LKLVVIELLMFLVRLFALQRQPLCAHQHRYTGGSRQSRDDWWRHRRPEEEIADGVQPTTGARTGGDVRRQPVLVERRPVSASRRTAPERDAGENLVSEPAEQMETPDSWRIADHPSAVPRTSECSCGHHRPTDAERNWWIWCDRDRRRVQ